MKPVLSREQIRALDRHAIEACGVPSLVLMENAGKNAAAVIRRKSGADVRAVIVCGPGNNGGDGLVVARHLLNAGGSVEVFLVGPADKLSPDARVNYDVWRAFGGAVTELSGAMLAGLNESLARAGSVVDGLFGTGLDREIVDPARSIIDCINRASVPRFALDIPSGLHADTGRILGAAVRAAHTVTFAHLKPGLLTTTGADHCGEIEVVDIGVPDNLAEHVGYVAQALESGDVARLLVPRRPSAHKGTAGRVIAFTGSPGKIGAALLVGRGALRAGAGLVTLATFPAAADALDRRVLEAMTARLEPGTPEAGASELLQNASAAAIGPGLGHSAEAARLIDHVVLQWEGVTVVDADALSHFAGRAELLRTARGRLVLTPHPAELARLLGLSASEVEADRFGAATQCAELTGAVVVLKGARTVIAAPATRPIVNCSGTPALASGGSGDVLTGILTALCCSLEPHAAAYAAVHVHGLAAERWSGRSGADRGLLAHEVADELPHVLAGLTRNHAALTV